MNHKLITVLLFPAIFICACERKAEEEKEKLESNPVKEFINSPKEKARDVRNSVEKKQEEEKNQAEELIEDD